MVVEQDTVSNIKAGPPTSPNEAYYWCDWCNKGLSETAPDPAAVTAECPSCGRSGDGVWRIAQKWVERRFEESDAVEKVRTQATIDGLANVGVLSERVRKARLPYKEDDVMAETETAEKPKREKKVKEKHPCACGCDVLTGGTWAPGHDARFYSAAGKVKNGKMTAAEMAKMFPAATIKAYADKAH